MAKIFLSYAREDASRAERAAAALEAAGHIVWWDREIGAGASFSAEIDRELADADLVVVLWSEQSIRSDWVRDEAAIGRDSGRLVPALISKVEPPLGFRQYQAVAMMGRGGNARLVDSVAKKLGQPAKSPGQHRSSRTPFNRITAIAAVAALLIAALAGWWLLRPSSGGNSIVIAASGGNPAQSSDLARSLARDLGRIRAGPLATLSILDDPKAKGADYRVEVAVSGSGTQRQADVALKQRGASGLLWSALIEDSSGRPVDMRQQVAAQVGEVLNCLAELGEYRKQIRDSSLSLYLRGCAGAYGPEALNILNDLTRREPRFGPGWANLALASAWQVPTTVAADRGSLIDQAKAALVKAKELAPNLPETAVADALIMPSGGRKDARAIAILDKAIKQNPDSPLLHGTRIEVLQRLGRMEESVAESERALDLNPLSQELLNQRATSLAYAGRPDAALAELAKAEKYWPGSTRIAEARFALDLRFGDGALAKKYLSNASAELTQGEIETFSDFLDARIDPSPANIERSLAHYRSRYDRNPAAVPGYLQALVIFGRIDEAFAIVAPDIAADSLGAGAEIFFRPYMAKFRADPRFMILVKRIGLVDAWEKTGVWPDFCSQPGLAYDCKAEARKVRSVPVLKPVTG